MDIVSHKGWGANYLRPLQRTNVRNKTAFLVHYHGGIPRNSVGKAVPKEVEAIHHANGWNGLGYNFAVDQAGTIYEGYGWDGVGAQCPGFNTSGIGTYVAIGGDQKPSDAALASVRWLYDEGCRRSGNTLRKMGHRDGWATACPGEHLYAWVLAGMPAPANFDQEDDEMATRTNKEIAEAVWLTDGVLPSPDASSEDNPEWGAATYLKNIANAVHAMRDQLKVAARDAAVARSLAEKQAEQGGPLSPEEVAEATRQGVARALSEAAQIEVRVKAEAPEVQP